MVLSQPQNQHVMKAFDLSGKVAVVTGIFYIIYHKERISDRNAGGARGIGLEVSRALAEAGANVRRSCLV